MGLYGIIWVVSAVASHKPISNICTPSLLALWHPRPLGPSAAQCRWTPPDAKRSPNSHGVRPTKGSIYIYSIPLHHLVGADGRRRLSGEGVRHGGREALLEEVHPRRIGVRLSDHLSFKNMMTSLESNQTYQVTR